MKGSLTKLFNTETGQEKPKRKNPTKKAGYKNVYQFKILLSGSKCSLMCVIYYPAP